MHVRWTGCSPCNGNTAPTASGSCAGVRVQGLERRGRRRLERAHVRRRRARRATLRVDRPRGVLRLSGDPAEDQADRRRQTREIEWPEVELYEARVPRAPRDLILLAGSEPSFRWRSFSGLIVEVAEAIGVQLAVSRSGRCSRTCRTPAPVCGHRAGVGSRRSSRDWGWRSSSYEGPTGIVGVLHAACQQAGLPSASLWAAVPHYIAAAPNPKAALALVRKLEGLVGVAVDASSSRARPADYERQVNLAVQSDPDVQAFVERLEQAAGEEADEESGPLPSGDTIARDLQRFLRQRGDEQQGPTRYRVRACLPLRRRDTPTGSRTPSTAANDGVGSNPCDRIPSATSIATSRTHSDATARRRPAPRPSRRRARSSTPAARRRGSMPRARPPRTARAARRRPAGPRVFGRAVL